MKVVETASHSRPTATRATSAELDHLRARALRGDTLRELTDARQEWVWRSLLKGVRTKEAAALAGMRAGELAPALEQVRRRYQRRLDLYKQAAEQQPRVRKPVTKPVDTSARARTARSRPSWWPFGARG